jgi:hypothetical protein
VGGLPHDPAGKKTPPNSRSLCVPAGHTVQLSPRLIVEEPSRHEVQAGPLRDVRKKTPVAPLVSRPARQVVHEPVVVPAVLRLPLLGAYVLSGQGKHDPPELELRPSGHPVQVHLPVPDVVHPAGQGEQLRGPG